MPRLPLACLGAACLLALAGPAGAAETFRVDGLERDDAISIRAEPDAAAEALGTVAAGRRVLGFGCTNDTPSRTTWCRVRSGTVLGWARRRYLVPE